MAACPTTPSTNVPDVASSTTALRSALELKRLDSGTPFIPEAWLRLLTQYDLISKYPDIPAGLQFGFNAGIPDIQYTFTPPNSPTILEHESEFSRIVQREFEQKRYLGPCTQSQVEDLIGPFQTSPLSLIPKPGKPGKFRIVQNLSFPYAPDGSGHQSTTSINSSIDSDQFPCTWGTFSVICYLIWHLPPESQAAVRDVKEAYRTVPIEPSQWPGLVVRLQGKDSFAIDTRNCFGLASGPGCYGKMGDAGADVFRARGITVSKWVDDHIFFRIKRVYLQEYNEHRQRQARKIMENGGRIRDGGRLWFRGGTMPDGRPEEHDEDMARPVLDLSANSPRSSEDSSFTCCLDDIDACSEELGIPWEVEKDIPFQEEVIFIGFSWNLNSRMVSLPISKKEKYLKAIREWTSARTHTRAEAEKLYGKLLHACLVIPSGRAYLTNLETFLAVCSDNPFVPCSPPRGTSKDMQWWVSVLERSSLARTIPGPTPIEDAAAYSDASSEIGIGITIGERWRAWRLLPGWKTERRDIGWAEAVGFLLLTITLASIGREPGTHLKVFGDNRGVVEGWWKGRSRNPPTNSIFRLVHIISESSELKFHTYYVPSGRNPADGPSRGLFPHTSLLLPAIDIPEELREFIISFDEPRTSAELRLIKSGTAAVPLPKPVRCNPYNEGKPDTDPSNRSLDLFLAKAEASI